MPNKYGDRIRHYSNQGPNYLLATKSNYLSQFNYYNPKNLSIGAIIREGFESVIQDNDTVHNLTLCIDYSLVAKTYKEAIDNEQLKSIYISKSNVDMKKKKTKTGKEIKEGDLFMDNLEGTGNNRNFNSTAFDYSKRLQSIFKKYRSNQYRNRPSDHTPNGLTLRIKKSLDQTKKYIIDHYQNENLAKKVITSDLYKLVKPKEIMEAIQKNNTDNPELNNSIQDYFLMSYKGNSIWSQRTTRAEKILYKHMEKHPMNQIENVIRDLTKENVIIFKIYLGERYNAYTFIPVQILYMDLKETNKKPLNFNRNARYSLNDKYLLLDPFNSESEARQQIFNRRKIIRTPLTPVQSRLRHREKRKIFDGPTSRRLRRVVQTQAMLNRDERIEADDAYKLMILKQQIVPEIKESIIEYLKEKIEESQKLKTKLEGMSKEDILKEGYTLKQQTEMIDSLTQKNKKLQNELNSQDFSLETITSVFYPMVGNNNVTAYSPIEDVIRYYHLHKNDPKPERVEQELVEPEGITINSDLVPPNDQDDCPICMDTLKDSRQCKLPCGHWFHCKCLGYYGIKNKCPVCREDYKGIESNTAFGIKRLKAILRYLYSL